ncbi:MAG: PH domain-containing protein, partial [Oscillospiraceae bacterium]
DKIIVYKKGVFFRHTQYMYRKTIVFATVYNNPLTPLLKISSLVVTSPGASIKILYMHTKRAEELAALLAGCK